MLADCFLARFAPQVPCDGPTDFCHLIPKQVLKREIATDDPDVIWHPSTYVPGCRRHHNMLDVERTLKIPRSELPWKMIAFCEAFGLMWWVEREYGASLPVA